MDTRIDFSRFTGSEEVIRSVDIKREQTLPAVKERAPEYFQRAQEREGRSEWSGGNFGGGTISGRSR